MDAETRNAHTPGPWTVTVDGQGHPHVVSEREATDPVTRARWLFLASPSQLPAFVYGPPAFVYGPTERETGGAAEQQANARLIAAAPDLLNAAQVMREWVGSIQPMPIAELQAMLDAAITKATGGE